jgi:hypothetical protein
MRSLTPTLSSLVRSILLEAAAPADEAVDVRPAVLHMKSDDYADLLRQNPADLPADTTLRNSMNRQRDKAARTSHAYVNTDRWREAVMRNYAFLDKHEGVGDVIVAPIAGNRRGLASLGSLFGDKHMGRHVNRVDSRLTVLSQEDARRTLEPLRVDLGGAGPSDIVMVPIVGAGLQVDPSPSRLPSAWMLVHSLFDVGEFTVKSNMTNCAGVRIPLVRMLWGPGGDIVALLINCGWSENEFHTVMSAYQRVSSDPQYHGMPRWEKGGDISKAYRHDYNFATVGKKFKSAEGVPVRPGKGYNVEPDPRDIAAEIMTACIVKPRGFVPDMSRFEQLPDEFLGVDSPEERQQKRAEVEKLIEEIKALTADLRDLLVRDLAGKVVVFAVH